MISIAQRRLTSSNLASIAQNTTQSVTIETTLKSIGRPGFILIDKDIDSDTKQYAAAKEFLYQALVLRFIWLLLYLCSKKVGLNLRRKIIQKYKRFEHFKNVTEYLHYRKLADNPSVNNRLATLEKELPASKTKVKKNIMTY